MKTSAKRTGKKTGKRVVAAKKPVTELRIATKLLREADAKLDDVGEQATKLAARVDALEAELGELRWAKRRNVEYYALVEKLLKERDAWTKMFLDQTAGNSVAQSHLMTELEKANHLTMTVIKVLNNERIVGNRPLFEVTGKLPDGSTYAKDYATLVAELKASAPDETLVAEALAERDRIRERELNPPEASSPPAE